MTGVLIAVLVGGLWMLFSAVILVSVCMSSSRFNQEECLVENNMMFVQKYNGQERLENLNLSPRSQVVQN